MKEVWLSVWMFLALALVVADVAAMEAPTEIVRSTTDEVLARVKSDRDALRQDPAKMYAPAMTHIDTVLIRLTDALLSARYSYGTPAHARWRSR